MTSRPLAVTIIGWLFVVVGAGTLAYFGSQFVALRSIPQDLILACAVDAMALAGGLLVLRGSHIGRWLVIGWMAFHVGLSILHSTHDVIVHSALLVLIVIALTRRDASVYFRGARQA
jgi:hypothetical protein